MVARGSGERGGVGLGRGGPGGAGVSLRHHCDMCHRELGDTFQVIGFGKDRMPTRFTLQSNETVEWIEVCSASCAVAWITMKWPAEVPAA